MVFMVVSMNELLHEYLDLLLFVSLWSDVSASYGFWTAIIGAALVCFLSFLSVFVLGGRLVDGVLNFKYNGGLVGWWCSEFKV